MEKEKSDIGKILEAAKKGEIPYKRRLLLNEIDTCFLKIILEGGKEQLTDKEIYEAIKELVTSKAAKANADGSSIINKGNLYLQDFLNLRRDRKLARQTSNLIGLTWVLVILTLTLIILTYAPYFIKQNIP